MKNIFVLTNQIVTFEYEEEEASPKRMPVKLSNHFSVFEHNN